MITITIPENELFDDDTQSFIHIKPQKIQLEHSLLSISKWESKWHKPFLSREDKTNEELIDYIQCMTITPNVDQMVYYAIPGKEIARINEYINDPMTATTISDKGKNSREIITSEIIYYNMIALGIPFECQKWHINRLTMLIRVCDIKNNGSNKKMSTNEILARNRALNAQRRKRLNTRG